MKLFATIVKYIVIPASSVIGLIYGFDMYVIQRANTVVEPTKIEVSAMREDIGDIKTRTQNIERILMERK